MFGFLCEALVEGQGPVRLSKYVDVVYHLGTRAI